MVTWNMVYFGVEFLGNWNSFYEEKRAVVFCLIGIELFYGLRIVGLVRANREEVKAFDIVILQGKVEVSPWMTRLLGNQ